MLFTWRVKNLWIRLLEFPEFEDIVLVDCTGWKCTVKKILSNVVLRRRQKIDRGGSEERDKKEIVRPFMFVENLQFNIGVHFG